MRAVHKFGIVVWLGALVVLVAMLVYSHRVWMTNGDPAILSGYVLVVLMVLLGLFSTRKRLSMMPAVRVAFWTVAHTVGGILAIGLFWIHVRGALWPTGVYEQVLATLFYVVSLSGLIGWAIQKVSPGRLTQSGIEVIYDRIPAELADIRDQIEAIVLQATEETGSDTLARHYLESLSWFFGRPRFFLSHAFGGQGGYAWIQRELRAVGRYVDAGEHAHLDRIGDLAMLKNRVDFHYAVQGLMKLWLFVHVPLAAALLALALWHVILVHVYLL